MPRFRAKGTLTRDAIENLWKHTLSRIPTVIGQIAYLAALRDANSGTYKHHGLAAAFGRDESTRALRESHERVFREWLQMPLPERTKDLRAYVSGLDEDDDLVARYWLAAGQAASQVPDAARPMESALFRKDLETLLKIIRNGSAASPRRSASTQSQ